MAALPVTAPAHVMYDHGVISTISGFIHLGGQRYIGFTDGAPTGGTGWVGKGTVMVDYTNGDIYMNTGTAASPTWTKKVD